MTKLTIYKYPLKTTDEQVIQMPFGATILSAQCQMKSICVWAIVNTTAPLENRKFRIFGTGHPFDLTPNEFKFIDTVQMDMLVFHVFEVI
jgi:hypothetical protein